MNSPDTQRSGSARAFTQASLIAVAIALLIAVALRLTTLPVGARVGVSFFSFAMAQAVLLQRATGVSYSTRKWAVVLISGVATAAALWFIAEL